MIGINEYASLPSLRKTLCVVSLDLPFTVFPSPHTIGHYVERTTRTCFLLFGMKLLINFAAFVVLLNGSLIGKFFESRVVLLASTVKSVLPVGHS